MVLEGLCSLLENRSTGARDKLRETGENSEHEDGKLNSFTDRHFNKHLSL